MRACEALREARPFRQLPYFKLQHRRFLVLLSYKRISEQVSGCRCRVSK